MISPFQSPEVRVVEASAGSGKTTALARRYVSLLLYTATNTPLALKHILAITFTNKAAAQMRERIIQLLKRTALGKLPPHEEKEILGPLGLDVTEARDLARGLMAELIRNYHFFGVQTIDSFMNTLLVGCAFKINLSAKFKLKRNALDYVQLSLDELIDEAAGDKRVKAMFEAFIRQYLFLENRSGWFPKKELLAALWTLFNQHNTYQQPFVTFPAQDADVFEHKKQFVNLVNDMILALPAATNKTFAKNLEKFVREHPVSFDVDKVSTFFAREQFPINGNADISDDLDHMWRTARRLMNVICLQEAYAVFNPYIELFNAVMVHFTRIQSQEDILFVQQLNKKTGTLFDENLVTVEELYYRLATRFQHYLIDEFQDTSAAQWHNLQLMVEECLSSGGTLFYVGDKKQAIYSFRGGESRLFDELKWLLSSYNIVPETLSINRRSHAAIVSFNNRVFALDNLRRFMMLMQEESRLKDKEICFVDEDWQHLENVFGSAQQHTVPHLPHGAVRAEIIPGRKKEERDELIRGRLLMIVADAVSRFALKDIAVLTRNNIEVYKVTQWLLQEGIYAQSERTSDVKSHALITELVAYLRFMHSPIDNTAFAEFLLGEIFPAVSGMPASEIQEFLFACRLSKHKKSDVYFYKLFREQYPVLWNAYFEEFFNQAGIYPLYELAVSICGRLRCLTLFPDAQGFVMHFLELIKRREEESCDLETFLDYYDDLEDEERFVPMPQQDAVRVLTIHKAKGLEFPVVIIPFMEMSIKPGSGDKNGGQAFTWESDKDGMHLLRLKDAYTTFSEQLRDVYAGAYKAAFFAELNNVYVALTRPVYELYVLIPERVGNSVNPLPLLVPPEWFSSGQVELPAKTQELPDDHVFLPAAEYQSWTERLREEFLDDRSSAAKARLEGEILHFALAHIGNLNISNAPVKKDTAKTVESTTAADPAAIIAQAAAAAHARYGDICDEAVCRVHLMEFITRAHWRPYFYLPAGAVIATEQEVVNRFGDTRRLDRVIIAQMTITIIDFKSTKADGKNHQQQIDEYKDLLASIYPGYHINTALLYFDEREIDKRAIDERAIDEREVKERSA